MIRFSIHSIPGQTEEVCALVINIQLNLLFVTWKIYAQFHILLYSHTFTANK